MVGLPFIAVAVFAVCYAVARLLNIKHDPKEPLLVPSRIPLVGHILGILQKRMRYYIELRKKYGASIYSLAMPNRSKLYIITSTELIAAVQRQPKVLAFPPIGVKFAVLLAGTSPEATRIAKHNINGEHGNWGLSMDFNKVVYPALTPGMHLDAMNKIILSNLAASFDRLRSTNGQDNKVPLIQWVRHELTMAITEAVYGQHNPFRAPAAESAFWDFEDDLFSLMVNIVPSITAKKGYRGRAFLTEAFLHYFQKGGLQYASVFAQKRYESANEHGVPLRDIARLEVVNLIGILTSTVRTVTWMLYYLYSDPRIHQDCTSELSQIISEPQMPRYRPLKNVDISKLRSDCPILRSTFQEVLRRHSLGTSVRQVMQDTLLEGTYLLKKDNIILMPGGAVHTDTSLWGSNVHSFNHRRFLKHDPEAKGEAHKAPSPAAFRAFGGGTTLCPGRHLATNVTMATTVMFLARYKLEPVTGVWPEMTAYRTHAVAAVEQPDYEVQLQVQPTDGSMTYDWTYQLNDSAPVYATTAEDLT